MPPPDITAAERQRAINQLATTLLPLVKHDVTKANNYALQLESKIYDVSPTRESWCSKINAKLKSVQQKVAQQQGTGASGAAPQAMQPAPQQAQHPAVMVQQSQPQQPTPQQAVYSAQPLHMPAPQAMHPGMMQASAFAQQQQPQVARQVVVPQPAQTQAQQQFMTLPPPIPPPPHQQQPGMQQQGSGRSALYKMPTFTDPAFQNYAKAFLESSDENTAATPAQQQATLLAQQQAQQQQQQQAALQAQQQQAAMQAQQRQAAMQAQQQRLQQQQAQQQAQQAQALHVRQQQVLQQAQQYGQPAAPMVVPPAQPALAAGVAYQHGLPQQQPAAAMMPQGQQPTFVPMQAVPGQQVQQQQQQLAAAAAQYAVSIPPELAAAHPHLGEYMGLQTYARVNLLQDAVKMINCLSNTADPQGTMQRRLANYNERIAIIEDREPHRRMIVDAAAVGKLTEMINSFQKDIHKFRAYLANHNRKVMSESQQQQQSGIAGPGGMSFTPTGSLPNSAQVTTGAAPAGGAFAQGQHSLQPPVHAPQPQIPPNLVPNPIHGLPLTSASPGAAMAPISGPGGFITEIMDESQPTPAPPAPAAHNLTRAGSSSLHATAAGANRAGLPPLAPGGAAGMPLAGTPPGQLGQAGGSAAAPSDVLRQQAAGEAFAAGTAAQRPLAGGARPAGRQGSLPGSGSVPLDPPDRVLIMLERRSDAELSVAAMGVQRLLQHVEAAIPMPPLPPEALRLDGWPKEAVEALLQSPTAVLSRPSGSARIGKTGTAAAPGSGEEAAGSPAAKRQRVEGEGTMEQEACGGSSERSTEWEQLRGRVAADCQRVEARLGEAGARVTLKPGAAPPGNAGGGLTVTCKWQGPAVASASATPPPTPPSAGCTADWRQLQLRVGAHYPAEPPAPVFPSRWPSAGSDAALGEMVKDYLRASLPGLPQPVTLEAVVDSWARAVDEVGSKRSALVQQ